MLQETKNPSKRHPFKIEDSLRNLYISLKYKMASEDKKPYYNDYHLSESEKLKTLDITILMDYLKEMIDIYADFKIDKALLDNDKKKTQENKKLIDNSKNDIEILLEDEGFDCLTIKHEISKRISENLKSKDYDEYEKIIKKLEAEIRNRIQIENELKIEIELLEVKIEQSSNIFQEMKDMQKKIDSYEDRLIKQECSESDKKENEILILRAENCNLKKYISEKETEIRNLKNEIAEFKKESREILTNKKLIIKKLNSQINKYEKNLTVSNSSSNINTITNTNVNTNLNTNNTNTIISTNNHNFNLNLDMCQALSYRNQYFNQEKDKIKKDRNIFNKNQKIDVNGYSSNSSRLNLANAENSIGNVQTTNEIINPRDLKRLDKNFNLDIKLNNDFISIPSKEDILNSACSIKNKYIKINEDKEVFVTNDFKQTGMPKKDRDNKLNIYKNIFEKLTGLVKKNDEVTKLLENNSINIRKQISKNKQDSSKPKIPLTKNITNLNDKIPKRNNSNSRDPIRSNINPQKLFTKEQIDKEMLMKKTLLQYSKLNEKGKQITLNQPKLEFCNNIKTFKQKNTLNQVEEAETPKNFCFSTREKASARRGLSSAAIFSFPKCHKEKKTIDDKENIEMIPIKYCTPIKNKPTLNKKI